MAEFGPSGIEALPPLTWEANSLRGDPRTLGWILEAVQEGDRINMGDPMYASMDAGMRYVEGNQTTAPSNQPAYAYPNLRINECRSALQNHVSALTDIKPLFSYRSMNPKFALHADTLNKLTMATWIANKMDVELGHCVKYSLAAGTGDLVSEWDPYAGYGGDIRISARDARDTLPWRPALHDRGIQAWQGCIIRESHTVNVLRGLFPEFADVLHPTTDSLLSTVMARFRSWTGKLVSPAADTLSGLNVPAVSSRMRSGEVILYRVYLEDRSTNLTGKPVLMGRPGAAWTYQVPPGGRLYPYKRLIVCTPQAILYDGPNTYWHGEYPIARLKLWDLPWNFLGQGLFADLIPVQDTINKATQNLFLAFDQWMNRAVKFNRGAVSETFMKLFDARRPGQKVKLTDAGMREGFAYIEGPPAPVMALMLQAVERLSNKFKDLSGTPNLEQILALRQLPGAETIQRAWEAMTPELRQEGRSIETFLGSVGEQHKVLHFQYESNKKRVQILGTQAELLEDYDFDPETLVPSMDATDADYDPAYDRQLPRDVRARAFHKSIALVIAPNSLLNLNATEQKMMKLQLSRAGMYDFWSLGEALEIPNIGAPPPMPLPPLNPEQAQQEAMELLALPAPRGQQEFAKKFVLDPRQGLLEIRLPVTVTERLQAQQMLGIGMTENPAGRKASGQAPPQQEQKSDGRTTVSESRHEKGPGSQ